jgi:hypothetical protein
VRVAAITAMAEKIKALDIVNAILSIVGFIMLLIDVRFALRISEAIG